MSRLWGKAGKAVRALRAIAARPRRRFITGHSSCLAAAGNLPARGFCNGMAVASSGRFLLAAVGQEPRLGRWARDKVARNGVLLHMLAEGPSVGEDGVERGDDESDD